MDNHPQCDPKPLEVPKSKKSSGRSKYGCLTCRAKRVKCDENLPTCRRCDRLKLVCNQPFSRILPSLGQRRRGIGSWKSRSPEVWSPKPILPNLIQSPQSSGADDADVEPNVAGISNSLEGEWLPAYPSPILDCSATMSTFQNMSTGGIMGSNIEWLLPHPPDFDTLFQKDIGLAQLKSIPVPTHVSIHDITFEDGNLLTENEKKGLTYFRTYFSLSQTTRDPQWSTTTLLLDHGLKDSTMLLHLILAVSLYDLQFRGELPAHENQAAQRHYEIGAQSLAQSLQSEETFDHVGVLGSLYCVYAYMSRQSLVSSSKVDRLSYTALEYIKKKGLDICFLTPIENSTANPPETVASMKREYSLVARLIMWLFKIDSQCGFLGCKPSLLEYFQARPQLLEGVHATSRLALQLNWCRHYPISQSIRDIESTMSVDMMVDLLITSHRINNLSQVSALDVDGYGFSELRKCLDRVEVKFGVVFYYGSSEMTLQPAMKLNCATSAAMFYATKIYLLSCLSGRFGAGGSSEATSALGQLLLFAKHVCMGGAQQPVYEFQWSLFIACLESNDMIHQEWLQSKICDPRFRGSLERIFGMKRSAGGEIYLKDVRTTIQGPS